MWQSGGGKIRIDTPHTSVISDPAGQRTIMLDHLKKEAMVIPMPPPSPSPSQPGGTQVPAGAPKLAPPLAVHDLGKSLIEGHEVEGKRYTFSPPQAPPPPKSPQMPKMPVAPQSSKPPQPPKPPQLPKPPQPTVTEVWTSVKLKMPVLTKVTSSVGEQTTYCKPTSTEEPHPSVFEIPPGYKLKNK
jgi:hypothetical protein